MKNIEIITTQNVVLQYELAGLRDRGFAFFIDLLCLTISLSILSAILFGVFGDTETGAAVVSVFLSCLFIFYSLLFEVLNNGQSIGKMAMRIQVIRLAGGQATFSDYAARWVFRLIDIYLSLGSIASILIMSSPKGQRIGDVVANTAVVRLIPKMDLDLQALMNIHGKNTYTPKYPQARKLNEEEALLIKQALDRYRKFQNAAHRESIEVLAQRMREFLDIDHAEDDRARFLQTVLQDYVILTR